MMEAREEPGGPDEAGGVEIGSSSVISRVGLNDNKAGMQGLDKDKINRIILENSIGSKFYESERKKDAQVDKRIQNLLVQVEAFTPSQIDAALGQANVILDKLENSRDLTRTIVHIDMDAFYAAVEERDDPTLKNKPMAVGGMGMLSTSNYIARRYGVRAAMPGFIGKKLCPDLVLVPTNFSKYTEVSHQIRRLIAHFDPDFSPMSLDEAYLDITSYLEKRKLMPENERTFECSNSTEGKIVFGVTAEEVVKEIRFRIHQGTELTASAGIAPNALLAKVASDMNKPNGQYYLKPTRDDVLEFVRKLPIRKIGGIGKVSEKLLNSLGIQTCQHLYDQRAVIHLAFSQTMSSYLFRAALGIGATTFDNDSERKSISTERTFKDISNPSDMFNKCQELCEALEADAKKENLKGCTVTLKIKTAAFQLHTRSKTLHHAVSSRTETYPVIADLLRQELASRNQRLTLRLIGVGLSKLRKGDQESQQRSLEYFVQKAASKGQVQSSSVDVMDDADTMENALDDETVAGQSSSVPCTVPDTNMQESDPSSISEVKEALFSCPLCEIHFGDSNELTLHVDKCAGIAEEKGTPVSAAETENMNDNNNEVGLDENVTCLTCPLCNATFCCQDISLKKFNSHVDSCLNRKTILELVKSDSACQVKKAARRDSDASSCPPRKRQKFVKPKMQTLDKFFK